MIILVDENRQMLLLEFWSIIVVPLVAADVETQLDSGRYSR